MTTGTIVETKTNRPEPELSWDDKLMLALGALMLIAVMALAGRAALFSFSAESQLTATLRAQPRTSVTALEGANSWWKSDAHERAALKYDDKTPTWHVVGTLPIAADADFSTYEAYLKAFREKQLHLVEQRVHTATPITPESYADVFKARLESAQCHCSVARNGVRVDTVSRGPVYVDDSPHSVYRDGRGAFDFLSGVMAKGLGVVMLVMGLAIGLAKQSPMPAVTGSMTFSFFWFAIEPLANFVWYLTMQRTWPL